ncbi:hypothetical protein ABT160_13380 [Streptomyces sp. NPDC001941]|uniref:hypothetical protein n=1 Tax=Streptomyces sp. NPDC001941 TaxID=3154659 RepID=UPI00332C9E41
MLLVLTLVLATLLLGAGLLTLRTGEIVVPWLRRRVRNPRVWALGALVTAAALVLLRFVPFPLGFLFLFAGIALSAAAQFDLGRRP